MTWICITIHFILNMQPTHWHSFNRNTFPYDWYINNIFKYKAVRPKTTSKESSEGHFSQYYRRYDDIQQKSYLPVALKGVNDRKPSHPSTAFLHLTLTAAKIYRDLFHTPAAASCIGQWEGGASAAARVVCSTGSLGVSALEKALMWAFCS